MNDFLDQIWFDNPVRNYLIVAGVILFVLVLRRIISRYLAGLLFKGVNRIWKDVDKKSFISLLIQPLGFFLIILVSIIALYKLYFPARLNIDIYGYSTRQILHGAGSIVLIISFTWLLLRIIDFIATILERKANLTPDQSDNQLIVFFRDFFKVVVSIIGIMMILNYAFSLNVGSLITGLSIVGAAIALALRESLENLIASFIIFFDKPFTQGDTVKVQQVTGAVERIGLRSTKIRTEQKTLVSVPNKQMVDSILDNLTLRIQRKGEIRLELGIETTASRLESMVLATRKLLDRKDVEESHAYLNEISGHSFIILADYFTAPLTMDEFNSIRQEINLEVLKLMEELEISLSGIHPLPRVTERDSRSN
jgi:MscS family membrane protein